jgi:hypothetical protein
VVAGPQAAANDKPHYPEVFTKSTSNLPRSSFPKKMLLEVQSLSVLQEAVQRFADDDEATDNTQTLANDLLVGLRGVAGRSVKKLASDPKNTIAPLLTAWISACREDKAQQLLIKKHLGMVPNKSELNKMQAK